MSDTISINQQSSEGEEFALEILDDGPSPHQSAQRHEAHQALEKALLELGEDQRRVVVLKDVMGLSYEEIATVTGMAVGTVKSSLAAAIGINFIIMLFSPAINRFLSKVHALGPLIRLTGLVIAAVAVQMIITGLKECIR